MKGRYFFIGSILVSIFLLAFFMYPLFSKQMTLEDEIEFELFSDDQINISKHPYLDLSDWKRPQGPLRIGLQVGHWKNSELPDELSKLRGTSLGASSQGYTEWEVCLEIAKQVKILLEEQGFVVDLLPATIPPAYFADLFIALHADGSYDTRIDGFKVAAPWWDMTGKGKMLETIFEKEYKETTGMRLDENVTRNMKGYYAFNWYKYHHAIHPMTPAIILELGFLTSWNDRNIMVNMAEVPAMAIKKSVLRYFEEAVSKEL